MKKIMKSKKIVNKKNDSFSILELEFVESKQTLDKQTNLQISNTLKNAAIELDNFEKVIDTKDSIVNIYKQEIEQLKANVIELEGQVSQFKQEKFIELSTQKVNMLNEISNLYLNLGVKKTVTELDSFNLGQLKKLKNDLNEVSSNRGKPVRQTRTTQEKNVGSDKIKNKKFTAKDNFETLFMKK